LTSGTRESQFTPEDKKYHAENLVKITLFALHASLPNVLYAGKLSLMIFNILIVVE